MRVLTIQTAEYWKRLCDKDLSSVDEIVYYTGVYNEEDRFERDSVWEDPVYAHAGIGTRYESSQISLSSISRSWGNWLNNTRLEDTVMIYAEVPDEYIVCLKEDRVTNLPLNNVNIIKLGERGNYEDFIVVVNELKLEWVLSVYNGPCHRHYNTMDVKCIWDSGKAPLLWNGSAYLNGDGYLHFGMEDVESDEKVGILTSAVLIDDLLPDKVPYDAPLWQLKGVAQLFVCREVCFTIQNLCKGLKDIDFVTIADLVKDNQELETALSPLIFCKKEV